MSRAQLREKLIAVFKDASDDFVCLKTEGRGQISFMVTVHWDRVADAVLKVIDEEVPDGK